MACSHWKWKSTYSHWWAQSTAEWINSIFIRSTRWQQRSTKTAEFIDATGCWSRIQPTSELLTTHKTSAQLLTETHDKTTAVLLLNPPPPMENLQTPSVIQKVALLLKIAVCPIIKPVFSLPWCLTLFREAVKVLDRPPAVCIFHSLITLYPQQPCKN